MIESRCVVSRLVLKVEASFFLLIPHVYVACPHIFFARVSANKLQIDEM